MNGRKERGIRRRYERIEGIVTQIFSSTRKLVTIYWELIRVRGGSYTEYVTRESEAKEKLALSSNDVRRERYHHLLDLVVVVDFSWCRKSRGRASISGSLSILSLFFSTTSFPLLLYSSIYNSTKHTFILLLFKCLTSFDYLLHVLVGKISREKYGEMLDSERKNRRKTKNCLDGGWVGFEPLIILVEN